MARTGFLAESAPRTGSRGVLEKPYRATGTSWTLSVSRPEDQAVGSLAMIDALRYELEDAAPDDVVTGARLAFSLSEQGMADVRDRIEHLVHDVKSTDEECPAADKYGFYVVLHRQH